MGLNIQETIVAELGDQNPMDVTVNEQAPTDPFFQHAMSQFLSYMPKNGAIPAAARLALLCFQAGMLYERARAKQPKSAAVTPIR